MSIKELLVMVKYWTYTLSVKHIWLDDKLEMKSNTPHQYHVKKLATIFFSSENILVKSRYV